MYKKYLEEHLNKKQEQKKEQENASVSVLELFESVMKESGKGIEQTPRRILDLFNTLNPETSLLVSGLSHIKLP